MEEECNVEKELVEYTFSTEHISGKRYLILDFRPGAKAVVFDNQVEMMAANRQNAFIVPEVRRIDESCRIYYDITGKESAAARFNKRQPDQAELLRILQDLDNTYLFSRELLLDRDNFLFCPDKVYFDGIAYPPVLIYLPFNAKNDNTSQLKELLALLCAGQKGQSAGLLLKMASESRFTIEMCFSFIKKAHEKQFNVIFQRRAEEDAGKQKLPIVPMTGKNARKMKKTGLRRVPDMGHDNAKANIKVNANESRERNIIATANGFCGTLLGLIRKPDTKEALKRKPGQEEKLPFVVDVAEDENPEHRATYNDRTVLLCEHVHHNPYFISSDEAAENKAIEYEVKDRLIYAGRNPESCDWLIESNTVGRVHAKVEYDGVAVAVSDEGSVNGTCINGIRLVQGEKHELADGDKVMFADLEFIFKNNNPA